MKEFTGFDYLLIDAANNYGLDKLRYEDRIEWARDNLSQLETLAVDKQWKHKPQYIKAVQAIRKAQAGKPTGHMVGLDAVCSGLQLMSVLSGCVNGARATGLVDLDRRADAYTECTEIMGERLGQNVNVDRDDVKQGLMTAFYGSRAEPKKVFGEDTPELAAFYEAMYKLSPGSTELLDVLLHSWQPWALVHEWRLPDGFLARVKVMQQVEKRIEVDELNHATFTYTYSVNEGEERGVKNAANVIHSIDGYVLRSLVRRCSYDRELVQWSFHAFQAELLARELGHSYQGHHWALVDEKLRYYIEQYERSGMADIVILSHLSADTVCALSSRHLRELAAICGSMLEHKPFPVITVHDCFAAHPNNLNWVRKHYRNILAELAESNLIQDILCQLHGRQGNYAKKSQVLGDLIRKSNYAIC